MKGQENIYETIWYNQLQIDMRQESQTVDSWRQRRAFRYFSFCLRFPAKGGHLCLHRRWYSLQSLAMFGQGRNLRMPLPSFSNSTQQEKHMLLTGLPKPAVRTGSCCCCCCRCRRLLLGRLLYCMLSMLLYIMYVVCCMLHVDPPNY